MLSAEEKKQYENDIQEQEASGFQNGAALSISCGCDELFDAFILESMDTIKEMNFEIGVLLGSKETFSTRYVNDLANYFINLAKYKIEAEYDNISRWRKEKESCRIPRRRSDSIGP
jgi:hypothetical protein